jgi:transmembrane sensor
MAAGTSGSATIFIGAGEQAVVTFGPTGTISSRPANIAAATAWTHRSLVFDSSPLTEVAEEFNRYNARPIVIMGTQLAEFHVSGVFSSVEPSLFLRFLRAQPELVVVETGKEVRISKK